jgi:phage protein D
LGPPDAPETLLSGEITGLEPSFLSNARPVLIVRGYDRRHRLHRRRATRTFLQQKDSDIASTIVQEVGLTPQVTDSQVVHDYLLQADQTDMEFLQERARRIEYEMVVDGQTLFFRPVQNAESEVLTLTPDDDLLEFYPRLSTMGQPTTVEVRAWSLKDKDAFVSDAQAGDEVSSMSGQQTGAALADGAFGAGPAPITSIPVFSQAEGDQIARAAFNRAILGLVSGEGVSRGRTDLRAGKVIKIDQIGQRFSGQYYVHAVSHRYTPSSPYQTRFVVRRNAS